MEFLTTDLCDEHPDLVRVVEPLFTNYGGKVFLARRGPKATNEQGCWEFPGGRVEVGEHLTEAIKREFREEYDMEIAVDRLLSVFDHILHKEGQHWVSPTYLAHLVGGQPKIMEPEKCTDIGWFSLGDLPEPLSQITQKNLKEYKAQYSSSRNEKLSGADVSEMELD